MKQLRYKPIRLLGPKPLCCAFSGNKPAEASNSIVTIQGPSVLRAWYRAVGIAYCLHRSLYHQQQFKPSPYIHPVRMAQYVCHYIQYMLE